jgi:hypothetical protein
MSENDRTFLSKCLDGEACVSEIDDYIDAWHDGEGTRSLPEFLGLTDEEYAIWVEQPEALRYILFAHKYRVPLAEALQNRHAEFIAAARTADHHDADVVLEWLRSSGRLAK